MPPVFFYLCNHVNLLTIYDESFNIINVNKITNEKGKLIMQNIQSFKGRTIEAGDKVKAYFDLHRKIFSLQIGTLVHGKAKGIHLKDVTFEVNENNRMKVVASGVKNVHAKVHGTVEAAIELPIEGLLAIGFREATYNPYRYNSFVDKETKEPIHQAKYVQLQGKQIYYF